MNRMANIVMMLLLVALSGTTTYYATKATVLERHATRKSSTATSPSTSPSASSAPSITPSSSSSPSPAPSATAATKIAVTGDRLSQPAEIYTVQNGDTLYPIGLKYDLAFAKIAETNNLSEPYKIKPGQTLIIPHVEKGVYSVVFTSDPGRATDAQTKADQGKDTWRLDPAATAKAEHSGVFGLSDTDDYRVQNRDDAAGTATVLATRLVDNQAKNYEISLLELAKKGGTGVWSISQVVVK